MKILLVEDNPNLTKMLIKLLEAKGHKIVHSENCKNGIQLLMNDTFDVIMVNLSLPDSLGLGIMKILDDNGIIQHNHVITISKDMTDETEKELKSRGVEYCFRMPVTPEAVMQAIDSFSN